MEAPVYTNSLVPYRLVMRTQACAYCGTNEGTEDTLIIYLLGITHCREHGTWATRDCNAYLHEKQMVPAHLIGTHPALSPLAQC